MAGQSLIRVVLVRGAVALVALLLPLGMLSSWTASVLSDTDRYVDTVAPLASDPVVKKAAVKHLTRETVKLVEGSADDPRIGDVLRRLGYDALADAVRPQLERAVRAVVVTTVESPYFADAWREANRSAHAQLVAVLEGRRGAILDDEGRVSIELGTVLNTIRAALQRQGLPVGLSRLPTVDTSFALVKADDLDNARFAYETLKAAGFWLPIACLAAAVLALVLSGRRWRTLRSLGTVSAVAMILLLLLLAWVRSALAGSSGDPEVTRVIWDVVVSDLRSGVLVAMVVGALVAVGAGWMSGRSATEAAS
ncbi:hypothetical protein [Nocardioides marmoriginsengisoli]|uniref:hypothetical protein n=1 Tax=Nocardioides marmoriginsengisoli TaxID=661483 RepID=UPI00162049D2|nr:hypothetical protein [Nocardioides marmoriginsengisoli]